MTLNRKARRTVAKQARSTDFKSASEQTLDLMTDKALKYANMGKWQEAETVLQQIIKAHPRNAEANHLLGIVLGKLGRPIDGIVYLKNATEIKPGEALYWNNLAVCLLAAARSRESADVARKAVIINPNYAAAWDSLGDALTVLQDFAGAKLAYERSLVLKGAETTSLKRLANCLMNIGNLQDAEVTLRRALELDAMDVDTISNLGAVLVAVKRYSDALIYLEQIIERKVDQFSVVYDYARALAGTDQRDKAIRWFRRATSINHRNSGPWIHLGELLLAEGNFGEAFQAAKFAINTSPTSKVAIDLMERIEQVHQFNKTTVTTQEQPKTIMQDFYLGSHTSAKPAQASRLNVTFSAAGVAENIARTKFTDAKQDEGKNDTLDLTILKIGS